MLLHSLRQTLKLARFREFGMSRESCALCDTPVLVRLRDDEIGVRCPRCGASAITLSMVAVLKNLCPRLTRMDVYEMSARGPLAEWLQRRAGRLTTSEYAEDIKPGSPYRGATCQDVQKLTYPNACFDLCTSTEVFEHVEDDRAGFSEVLRILRPGGWFIFTVPMTDNATTVERTELRNGARVQIMPAEYHADRYRGHHVFCFRNYGRDIVDRLHAAGFTHAGLHKPAQTLFGHARRIIAARKSA